MFLSKFSLPITCLSRGAIKKVEYELLWPLSLRNDSTCSRSSATGRVSHNNGAHSTRSRLETVYRTEPALNGS